MLEENKPDLASESEMDWGKLEAQAAAIDDINSPQAADDSPPEPEISSAELVGQAIQVTADLIAPNWKIQGEESQQLGVVYGALLDKYLPDSDFSKYGLEISALIVTGMILKSRAGVPLQKEKKKKPEQIKPTNDQGAEVYNQQVNSTLEAKVVSNV